jgi:hypothetical protein
MGLAKPVLELLAKAHCDYRFRGPVLTLGSQTIDIGRHEVLDLLAMAGVTPDAAASSRVAGEPAHQPLRADEFFALLGAEGLEVLDLFAGEGATIRHDLGTPVPPEYRGAFQLVVDGGTLEHVFDVAAALRNIVSLLEVGGIVVHVSPLSGWENHGFFTIQPKLLHRTYCASNGFDEVRSWLVHLPRALELGEGRIEPCPSPNEPFLCDGREEYTLLVFAARKKREAEVFAPPIDTHQRNLEEVPESPCAQPDSSELTAGRERGLRDDLLYWKDESDFAPVLQRAVEVCGPGPADRYYLMKELLLSLGSLDSDTAECGIFCGLGSYLLCHYARELPRPPDFRHLAFDSFAGLSRPGPEDLPERADVRPWWSGAMAADLETVRGHLERFSEIEFHVGWIPRCFDSALDRRFCFVHIDVDIYQPTRDALAFFYPRTTPGGILLFDDYGFLTCPGARRAIDEFAKNAGECLVRLPTGQAFLRKKS